MNGVDRGCWVEAASIIPPPGCQSLSHLLLQSLSHLIIPPPPPHHHFSSRLAVSLTPPPPVSLTLRHCSTSYILLPPAAPQYSYCFEKEIDAHTIQHAMKCEKIIYRSEKYKIYYERCCPQNLMQWYSKTQMWYR